MRKLYLSLALIALVFTTSTSAAPLHVSASCTVVGTDGDDVRVGTTGIDYICLLPGNDYAHGGAGDDTIRGGKDPDSLVGGTGRDVLRGGLGNDKLFASDHEGDDILRGGPGEDQCFIDEGDTTWTCEQVFVHKKGDRTAEAALRMTLGAMTLGAEAQEALLDAEPACLNPHPPWWCGA